MVNKSGIRIITDSSVPENTIILRGEVENVTPDDIGTKKDNNTNNHLLHPVINKERYDELHSRETVFIRHDLAEKIRQYGGGVKGAKSIIVNEALEAYFKKLKV